MNYTPFYNNHVESGGKIVDFGGWALPVNYGSQIKEHEAVRTASGMFDVSHMVITDVHGADAKNYLQHLITNDVNKLEKHGFGKALYSAMLNQEGYVIDDLIVYYMPFGYRIVSNAATEVKDLNWMRQVAANFKVELFVRRELAMLAVQGPEAIAKVSAAFPTVAEALATLKPFAAVEDNGCFFARTGYTGENGLEIMIPKEQAPTFWLTMLDHGVVPCGLGARDTLRLEAGMNLYGNEMDESISPVECGMDWVVDLTDESREFMGKRPYIMAKNAIDSKKQVGIILTGKGVLRSEYKVQQNGQDVGVVTSGTFSPTLKISIGIARVNNDVCGDVDILIRDKIEPAKIVKMPFVRNGKQVYTE